MLLECIQNGVNSIRAEHFAYASGFDEAKNKYIGLEIAQIINPSISLNCLIVKAEVAQAQIDAEAKAKAPKNYQVSERSAAYDPSGKLTNSPYLIIPLPKQKSQYYADFMAAGKLTL